MLNINVDGMEEKVGILMEMFCYVSFLLVWVSIEGRFDFIKLFYCILKWDCVLFIVKCILDLFRF